MAIVQTKINFNLIGDKKSFFEYKNPTYIMDALVFIQGVEVSSHLTGALSITLCDRDGFNTATIQLDNAFDRWILTTQNLGGGPQAFRTVSGTNGAASYSELEKKLIYDYKNNKDRNPTTSSIDGGSKIAVFSPDQQQLIEIGSTEVGSNLPEDTPQTIAETTVERKWPLNPRAIIFNKNDPVRIFLKNPLSERDEWFYGFTGYVDTAHVTTEYVSPTSEVQITCYDIKALMQKMRVQMNPVIGLVVPEPLFTDPNSLFADLIVPTNLSNPFQGLPLEDAVKALIIGTGAITIKNADGNIVNTRGFGQFTLGKEVVYPGVTDKDPSSDANAILDQWHAMSLVGPSDDATQIANSGWLTKAKCIEIGSGTTSDGVSIITGQQTQYAPHSGKLHFLFPKDGTGAKQLTSYAFEAGTEQRNFSTRYEVIHDFVSRLDYQWMIAPNGDMMFEFPMYDFLPQDFGQWANVFRFEHHLVDTSYSDETNDIPVGLIVTGGYAFTTAAPGLPEGIMPRAIIAAPILASRVGVTQIEQHSLPFVSDPQKLKVLAKIEYQKRLAATSELEIGFAWRPFLLPNRPIENVVELRLGLSSSVTNSISLFQDGSTSTALRYIRTYRTDNTYRLITGSAHMPVSYRKIFDSDSEGNDNVGVVAIPTTENLKLKDVPKDKKSFIKPVNGSITSGFGVRTDPVTGAKNSNHNGIDFSVPVGTEILAPGPGVITVSSFDSINGNYIIMNTDLNGDTYTFGFAHLSVKTLKKGDKVAQGTVIGLSGNTGHSTGPHVHMTLRVNNGAPVDPMSVPAFSELFVKAKSSPKSAND